MKVKPLINNALIRVIREDDGVSRTDQSESLRRGEVIKVSVSPFHLTASSALEFTPGTLAELETWANRLAGKIVRWEEYAEGGQTFEQEGKTYALIPWWRLISVEEA